jgi:predicted short-subunit dehydrogenase-like oxidoreductase (DUF2520 family)
VVPAPPLADLAVSLVGPGRVGESLAAWLAAAGARIVERAGRKDLGRLSTAGEDLLLLAVPDAALPEVAAALAARLQARVVLHTAGGLSAAALAPLAGGGSVVGTFHPLKAFPRPLLDPAEARGVFFALDGDPEAIALGRRLAAALGGEAAEVPAAARPLYHFAATLAAGGVTTLLAAAAEFALRLGLPPAVARGYGELARGAVAQALAAGDAASALTGPAARGDLETVERHLDELARLAPEKLPLALELAKETLRQRARREPPTDAQRRLAAALAARAGPRS